MRRQVIKWRGGRKGDNRYFKKSRVERERDYRCLAESRVKRETAGIQRSVGCIREPVSGQSPLNNVTRSVKPINTVFFFFEEEGAERLGDAVNAGTTALAPHLSFWPLVRRK